jgi:Icc protein
MLIAQITDPHIKLPGRLAYKRVDTAQMLRDCVETVRSLKQPPDLILMTGDLVDLGSPEEYEHLRSILAPLRQRIVVIPGNHDAREALCEAFRDGGYLPEKGFLQFVIEDEYPLRIIGLDTVVAGEGRGELCTQRLKWLDDALARAPDRPTLIMMHHPPFDTGIGHMDAIGLTGKGEFAAIMKRHAQVELIICGHLHRTIRATVGGRPALCCPSPAHQVALDIDPNAPSAFRMEPPGFMLHWWSGTGLVTHTATVGQYDGPYPFFDASGRLID